MSELDALDLAIRTIELTQDVSLVSNTGGDNYLFRNNATGAFEFGGDIWDLFRETFATFGGSRGLAELGLI